MPAARATIPARLTEPRQVPIRLAIISDIHGNLHALQGVWADLTAQAPDAVMCLGDLVGYRAYPNEVIDFM